MVPFDLNIPVMLNLPFRMLFKSSVIPLPGSTYLQVSIHSEKMSIFGSSSRHTFVMQVSFRLFITIF